uniref:WGS project CAEQ00000000 data, annotated contig 597 n=1 Tax=Trypanosoma congolense (strain IL3000) TaxID=1068625 RepID=F9WH57_TRYCI|nr:unnamed protein product [Trypanosoma congolense IL3000]
MERSNGSPTGRSSVKSKRPAFALTGKSGEAKRARGLIASIGCTTTADVEKAEYLVVLEGADQGMVDNFFNARSKRAADPSANGSGGRLILFDMLEEWSRCGAPPKRELRSDDPRLTKLFGTAASAPARRSYEVPESFLKRCRVTYDSQGNVVDESDNAVILGSKRRQPQPRVLSMPSPLSSLASPTRKNEEAMERKCCGDTDAPNPSFCASQDASRTCGSVTPTCLAFRQRRGGPWKSNFTRLCEEGSAVAPTEARPSAATPRSTGSCVAAPCITSLEEREDVVKGGKGSSTVQLGVKRVISVGRTSPFHGAVEDGSLCETIGREACTTPKSVVRKNESCKSTEASTIQRSRPSPPKALAPRPACAHSVLASQGCVSSSRPKTSQSVGTVRRMSSGSVKGCGTFGDPPPLPKRFGSTSIAPRAAFSTKSNAAKRQSTTVGVASVSPQRASNKSASTGHADSLFQRVRQSAYCNGISDDMCAVVLQQVVDCTSPVSFTDITGLEVCKRILQETIILPAKCPQLFTGLRRPCKGLLLFGPPGNGKTLLAKAVANECNTTFFNISAAAITSKWVGESEKMVRALFAVARALSPSTIFIDEVDSLLQARGGAQEGESSRRLKTEFLVQMDGAGNSTQDTSVLVMAATNRPFDLDDAIIRRFPKRVFVPLPDAAARRQILQQLLSAGETPNDLTAASWERIVAQTDGYSGYDLRQLCEDAAMVPVRELVAEKLKKEGNLADKVDTSSLRPITVVDVESCARAMKPSCSAKLLRILEEWNRNFGSK